MYKYLSTTKCKSGTFVIIFSLFIISLGFLKLVALKMSDKVIKTKRACVVVLGDIGRSPRMQYHSKSLADNHFTVDFIGYVENKPLAEIITDPRINIHKLTPFPEFYLPKLIKYIFKIFWQILSLLAVFISIKRPNFLICQNPPGIPTLFICYFYCKIVKAEFVIDWHNYTCSILALESPKTSAIVRIAKNIETMFGRKSDFNFCVTRAMKEDLELNWNINATVLYDRPPQQFQPISLEKKHELFKRLAQNYIEFKALDNNEANTAFTVVTSTGEIKWRDVRPGLLISSTSWTPDEDFQVLLNALEGYERIAAEDEVKYPKLICAITGKGPQKEFYQAKIATMEWKFVKIITPWLENEDYPLLLASSNLGVCLHYSSSGLDLPMKVVDMFGCGLPVCAMNFNCLNELVKDGTNGFIFNNDQELSEQLSNWFYGFPGNLALVSMKDEFAKNLKQFQALRWTQNWNNVALPHFR